MATLDDYNKIGGDLNSLYDTFKTNKDNEINKVKSDFGYDDRVKGLDTTRKSIMDAESILTNLPTNIKRRSAGRLMTNAQMSRLQAREQDPIVQNLTGLNRNLDVGQRGVEDIRSIISDTGNNLWNDYKGKADILNTDKATAFQKYLSDISGERQDIQNSLQREIANIQNSGQLRAAETQQKIAELMDKYNRDRDTQAYAVADKNKKESDLTIDTDPNANSDLGSSIVPGIASGLSYFSPFRYTGQLGESLFNGGKQFDFPEVKTGNGFFDDLAKRLADVGNGLYGGGNRFKGYITM